MVRSDGQRRRGDCEADDGPMSGYTETAGEEAGVGWLEALDHVVFRAPNIAIGEPGAGRAEDDLVAPVRMSGLPERFRSGSCGKVES